MQLKLVSICIPTYNSEKYLEETLISIINQTYTNLEIIIGDNASTDNTLQIITKYKNIDKRITFYTNIQNLGYAINCNKLISLAKGEYISIFHSDDIYNTHIIEKEIEVLNNNSDIQGVFTLYSNINQFGKLVYNEVYPITCSSNITRVAFEEYIKIILTKGMSCFCCPTSMIRKDVYKMLNGYDEQLKYIEDQDMWARILLNGTLAILDQKLIKYRVHEEQESTIYKNRKIDKRSLPLEHIINFLDKKGLTEKFKQLIDIAEASELIYFAKLAAINNNYNLFIQRIESSKNKYKFKFYSKLGLIQKFPLPRLMYLITLTLK